MQTQRLRTQVSSFVRPVITALVIGSAQTPLAWAQASTYIPTGEWSTPLIEHLIRTGIMEDPTPLTRPFRRVDVVNALTGVDTLNVSQSVRQTISTIVNAYRALGSGPRYWARGYVGMSSGTHARRTPIREGGNGFTAALGGAQVAATFGPIAVSSHLFVDGRLKDDPDYTGNRDKSPPHRFTDAYVSVQTEYANVFVGAMDRNWGPTGIPGTLVSSEPYSYDHVVVDVGTRHIRVEALITDLDPFRAADGSRVNRNWATQRVLLKPWPWLVAVVSQATLWTGAGRGFELRWLNPFKLTRSTDIDEPFPADSVNSVYGTELWIAGPGGATFQGAFTVDDFGFQFGSGAPDRLAGTAIVDVPVGFDAALRASFSFVSSLAYRSARPVETIMRRGIGLGRNFSDYTEVALQLTTMPLANFVVTPEVVLLRQGEGDFRKPFPPTPTLDQPFLFEGTIERTLRLGIGANLTSSRHIDVRGHVGVHFINNDGHVSGSTRTEAVAGIRLSIRLDGPVVFK